MHHPTIETFDIAISNPPYQLDNGDRNIQTIYHQFMEHAQNIADHVTMIYPARWVSGGSGNSIIAFRDRELHSRKYRTFTIDLVERFFNVSLDGDMCFFTWDKHYDGVTHYTYRGITEERDTLIHHSPVFLTNPHYSNIVSKVSPTHVLTPYGRDYYGKDVSVHWRIAAAHAQLQPDEPTARVWYFDSSKTLTHTTVPAAFVPRPLEQYKVFVSAIAHPEGNSLRRLGRIFLGAPGDVISTSFIQIGAYDTMEEAENMVKYLKTDFATFLFGVLSHHKGVRRQDFALIPALEPATGKLFDTPDNTLSFDTDSDGLDAQLADLYGLTPAERTLMQEHIRPWKDKNSLTADGFY